LPICQPLPVTMNNTPRRRGLTLVEVLVVIAVIGTS
jgi:prepilin-type N-terminal cleavage/methylation domain-containing protein